MRSILARLLPPRRETGRPVRAATLSEPSWRILGAASVGTSHLRRGLPCQDALDTRTLPGGLLLVALADGAGSAPRSAQGARWAVAEALRTLERGLRGCPTAPPETWGDLLLAAFAQAHQALDLLAAADCEPPNAFATTLTCAIATQQRLAVAQIGDGAVIARDGSGSWFAATRAQKGEYANETNFLTQPGALARVAVQVFAGPLTGLAAMSDGLLRLGLELPAGQPHAPFFEPLLAFAHQAQDEAGANARLAGFLSSERVCARTDDDKSLVLAAPLDSLVVEEVGG